MEEILTYLSQWLSSGPLGIVLGIMGLGGIGIAISVVAKRLRESKFQKEVTDASATSGRESASLSRNMAANTAAMDAIFKELSSPAVKAPSTVQVGEEFEVKTINISPGSPILADRRWIVGYTTPRGLTLVKLSSAGKRTIDIIVNDVWCSTTIVVKEFSS